MGRSEDSVGKAGVQQYSTRQGTVRSEGEAGTGQPGGRSHGDSLLIPGLTSKRGWPGAAPTGVW